MALIYNEQFDGYIVDNPNIDVERCDGTVFSYDEVNTASTNFNLEGLDITGGQYRLPVAHVDTGETIEFTFESSKFTMEIFEMAYATSIVTGDTGTLETKRYEVAGGTGEGAAQTVTLPFEVKAQSVAIRGLEEASAVAEGKFKVEITAATASAPGSTVITFNGTDVTAGDTIRISYRRRVVDAQRIIIKNSTATAKGEVWMHFPVYSSGAD